MTDISGYRFSKLDRVRYRIPIGPTILNLYVCAVKVTAMMKMTDVMHLPGLRFLDLEQVVPRNFDDVAGPKNDATWSIEKPE